MVNSNKIICALDIDDLSKALAFVETVEYDIIFKLGMEFFYSFGIEGIKRIRKIKPNIKIFLDMVLKICQND